MRTKDVVLGLQLLHAFRDDPDGYHIGAEHDVLYAYPTDRPLDKMTLERMAELGWFQEQSLGVDDDEWNPELYDAGESWAAYV